MKCDKCGYDPEVMDKVFSTTINIQTLALMVIFIVMCLLYIFK